MTSLKRAGEKDEAAVAQAEANRLDAESSALSLEKQMHELRALFEREGQGNTLEQTD